MEDIITTQEIIDHLKNKDMRGQPRYSLALRDTVIRIILSAESQIIEQRAAALPDAPPPKPTFSGEAKSGFMREMTLFTMKQHMLRVIVWGMVIGGLAWCLDLPRDWRLLVVCWAAAFISDWLDAMILFHNDQGNKKRGT